MKIMYYVEHDPEEGGYVAIVPSIPGAHTQAESLDELQENLKEVVTLCLEQMEAEERAALSEMFAMGQLEVAV